eukprot:12011896-Ditylum_brightwellii.AAC.1
MHQDWMHMHKINILSAVPLLVMYVFGMYVRSSTPPAAQQRQRKGRNVSNRERRNEEKEVVIREQRI